MKEDLWRFFSIFFLSVLIGIVLNDVKLFIIIGLSLFILWQYREFSKIHLWLKKRQEGSSPNQTGLIDETCREIDYLRDRNRSRKQKLSGYLKRFQDATGALPDAVIVLGEHGEIEWANKKALEYIGIQWPKDSGLRLSNLVRDIKLLEYLNGNEEHWERGLQINSPSQYKLKLEVRITAYGDTQRLLVARDITAISQINQMRKDFIANASHELRTPLTVISGYLESFVDDEECPRSWSIYLNQMRTQARRMQRLIEDLMQLSGLEAEAVTSDKQTVRVEDLLSGIINEARSLSGILNHQITLETEDDLCLLAKQQDIYSIFSNLVFNAVQYTPENGVIKVRWYQEGRYACFSVKDNGLGISSEHIPRLTERFYRVDKGRSRDKGGTGLGLAIVKHGLARYQAELMIHSELNRGSEFRCVFSDTNFIRDKLDLPKRISA